MVGNYNKKILLSASGKKERKKERSFIFSTQHVLNILYRVVTTDIFFNDEGHKSIQINPK
jgi:hypothetical protein